MFKLTITADSRVGCVRTNNEDMILVNDTFVRDGAASAQVCIDHVDRYLLALADVLLDRKSKSFLLMAKQ